METTDNSTPQTVAALSKKLSRLSGYHARVIRVLEGAERISQSILIEWGLGVASPQAISPPDPMNVPGREIPSPNRV